MASLVDRRRVMYDNSIIPVAWIANTSTSYIDTGYHPNAKSSIEITTKLRNYNTSGWDCIFGTTHKYYSLRQDSVRVEHANDVSNIDAFTTKNKGLTQNSSIRINFSCQDRSNDWHTIGVYANVVKIDGVTKATFDTPTGTTPFTNTLFLLQNNMDGQPETNDNAYRCYVKDARIWDENNELVRDYIPAYNRLTKRYGLYDKVGRNFYDSANGVPFDGPKPHDAGLPKEYTQVDFITFLNSKRDLIIFNETVYSTDCFEIDWQPMSSTTGQRAFSAEIFIIEHQGNVKWGRKWGESWRNLNIPVTCSRSKVKFDGLNNLFLLTYDKGKTFSESFSPSTLESSLWTLSDASYSANMRLFHCKRYVNGTLYRDLIPCRRDADGVYGLYDIVQNSFHTSDTALGGGNIKD